MAGYFMKSYAELLLINNLKPKIRTTTQQHAVTRNSDTIGITNADAYFVGRTFANNVFAAFNMFI